MDDRHDSSMNYELMADDLHKLIIDEGIESPVLLGHSMGGKTALQYNEKYKNVLKNLL